VTKYPRASSYLEERFYFGSWYQRFKSMVLVGPSAFGPVVGPYIMAVSPWQRKLFTYGGQEAERRKGQGPNIPFKGLTPVT
jgi:hypothetical protein